MFLIIFSCKKEEGKSQLTQNEEVLSLVDQGGGGGGYLCPPGQCPHYSYQLDVVNFHKPRTDCTKKFGFCVQGHWSFTCEPCTQWDYNTSFSNSIATGWAKIENNKIELHIPISISQSPTFIGEDMSIFYVDEDYIKLYKNGNQFGTMKAGEYSVQQINSDYVILIDIV
ncbi:MAG: hypothetical protein RL115_1008 [Bacteroidota bacterium]